MQGVYFLIVVDLIGSYAILRDSEVDFPRFKCNFHVVGENYISCGKHSRIEGVEGASRGFFSLKTFITVIVGCSLVYSVVLSFDGCSEFGGAGRGIPSTHFPDRQTSDGIF